MPTFKDKLDNEHVLTISLATIKRVHERCDGFNLSTLLAGEADALARLHDDFILRTEVISAACDEDLSEVLTGQSLDDGLDTLVEAVADYLPEIQGQRLKLTHAKLREVIELAGHVAIGNIDKLTADELYKSAKDD